jgi:hypothetical protein
MEAVAQTKEVAVAIKNQDFEKAMHLRDAEFGEYYKAFKITTASDQPELMLPEEKRMRIGIIHVGAPAGKKTLRNPIYNVPPRLRHTGELCDPEFILAYWSLFTSRTLIELY